MTHPPQGPTVADVIVAAFAAYAIVGLVRQNPKLAEQRLKWATAEPSRLYRLLRCGYCLSHWAGAVAPLLVGSRLAFGPNLVTLVAYYTAWALATAGAARLIHAVANREAHANDRSSEPDGGPEPAGLYHAADPPGLWGSGSPPKVL